MERYHIFKLGLAILFYAAYCIRPMMVNGLETDDASSSSQTLDNNSRTNQFQDEFVFYQGVQGKPGVDFPVLSHIPRTGFSCRDLDSGYYADLDTDCQVFHICEEGKKISFLCPNGTIFQQSELICEWWFKVNCTNSPNLYEESAEQLREDSARRKASRRVTSNVDNYGAVMRMEERASVSTSQKGRNFEIVSRQQQQQPQKVRAEAARVNNQRPSASDNHQQANRNDNRNRNNHRGNGNNNRVQFIDNSHSNRDNGKRQNEDEYVRITVSNNNPPVIRNKKPKLQQNQNNEYVRISAGNAQTNFRNQNTRSNNQNDQKGNQNSQQNRPNTFDSSSSNAKTEEIFQKAESQDIIRSNNNRPGNNKENRGSSNRNQNKDYQQNYQNTPAGNFDSQHITNENRNGNNQQGPSQVQNQPLANVNVENNQNSNKFYTQFSKNNPNRNRVENQHQNEATSNVQPQNRNNFPVVKTNQENNDQPIKIECCKNEQKTNNNQGQNVRGSSSSNANENIKLKLSVSLGNRNNIDTAKNNKEDPNRSNTQRTIKFNGVDTSNNIQNSQTSQNNNFGTDSKFNVGSYVKPQSTVSNSNKRLEPTESEESQVPQETASFVKNSYNSIAQTHKTTANPYPNHRETYSDLKAPQYYSTKILSAISSVTPQYLTTQPINNGRPFVGSQVGGTTKIPQSDFGGFGTRSSSTELPSTFSLNVGRTRNTNQYLPTVSTTETTVTNSIPTERFNVGNTDRTIQPAVVPSTTSPPVTRNPNLGVPSSGSLNLGDQVPTTRPSSNVIETSTKRIIDHATVYGKFVTSSPVTTPLVVSAGPTKIRYQPAQTFGESFETANSFNSLGSRQNGIQSGKVGSPKDEVTIRFNGNGAEISTTGTTSKVSHSKFESSTFSTPAPTRFSNTPVYNQNNGFYVTKNAEYGTRITSLQGSSVGLSSTPIIPTARSVTGNVVKPRPFQPSTNNVQTDFKSRFNSEATLNSISPTYPAYKISTASPFALTNQNNVKEVTLAPTQPTPLVTTQSSGLPFKNVDSMIDALVKMAAPEEEDHSSETPRPGLVIPPSAGPQTLHTLAVYFANALDGIAADKEEINTEQPDTSNMTHLELEKKRLTDLLTKMTMDRYNELFTENNQDEGTTEGVITTTVSSRFGEDLEGQHSKNPAQSPRVRQLAKVFTQALSSYLDDPATFKRVLQEVRPTEPPLSTTETDDPSADLNNNEDELLNFSDADSKSSYPPIFPTLPSVRPTWGYLVAFNTSSSNHEEPGNSLSPESENLQLADSQSFVSQYNKLHSRESTTKSSINSDTSGLPNGHWTSSPGATKLWKTAFSFDPATINNDFGTTEAIPLTVVVPDPEEVVQDAEVPSLSLDVAPPKFEPHHEIKYELRSLPKLALNSTQVHGILIDFMNTTKLDDTNRLQRILRKLNTTEDEFLTKMKEIEGNPLTRRLILLLISECGNNVTKEIEALPVHELVNRGVKNKEESLQTSSSIGGYQARQQEIRQLPLKSSSNLKELIDPDLDDDTEDARALQLLNSLYTIASRFGK